MASRHLALFLTVAVASWPAPPAHAAPQFGPPGGPLPGPPGPLGPPRAPLPPLPPGPLPPRGPFVPIIQQAFDQNPDGSYRWSYQSADGSAQEATGTVTNPGTPGQSLAVQGSYQYQSPEGPVQVAYIADDYGYQPTGNVVHPSIQRAVAYQVALAKSEPPGLYNEAGFPVGPVPPVPPVGPLAGGPPFQGPLPLPGPGGPGGPVRR